MAVVVTITRPEVVALIEEAAVSVVGIDNHKAGPIKLKMALDQRQHSFADGAEANHYDGTGNLCVHWPGFGFHMFVHHVWRHVRDVTGKGSRF